VLTAVLSEGDAAGQEYRMKLDKIQQYCFRHQLYNPNPITLTLTLYSP